MTDVAIYPSGATVPGGYDYEYTSMSAAEAAEGAARGDLVTNTDQMVMDIVNSDGSWSGSPDSLGTQWTGWVCSATYDILVRTVGDARNDYADGKWDTTSYILANPTASETCIYVANGATDDMFITFDGIQFERITNPGQCFLVGQNPTGSIIRCESCHIRGIAGSFVVSLEYADAGVESWFVNCIIENGTHGVKVGNDSDVYLYNSTITDISDDALEADSAGNAVAINCAVFNNADDFRDVWDTINYCASDDTDGTNRVALNENASSEWTNAFTDYTTGDFRVKDTDSLLYQAGLSQTADSNVPSTDIAGNARVDGSESIGAFEYYAAPTGPSIAQSIAVTESRTVELELLDLTISISESIGIAEFRATDMPLGGIVVFDGIGAAETIGEDMPLAAITGIDNIRVIEFLQLLKDLTPSIFESVGIQEFIQILASNPNISISQDIALTESISAALDGILGTISKTQSIAVIESIAIALESIIGTISQFDVIVISEFINTALEQVGINVSDSIGIAESIVASLPLSLTISDLIAISEYIFVNLDSDLNLYDLINVSENIQIQFDNLLASRVENLTVSEFISVTVSGIIGKVTAAFTFSRPGAGFTFSRPGAGFTLK